MPPRKAVAKPAVVEKHIEDSLSSDDELPSFPQIQSTPITVKYNSNDSDRIQLAQAINNLTVKGEHFVEALSSFNKFKENIVQLDIQIDSKKKEYKEITDRLQKEYNELNVQLDKQHNEKSQSLNQKYTELNRTYQQKHTELTSKLDSEYKELNRNLQSDYKNSQIEVKQKLNEFKLKACEELLKEFNMMSLKHEDYKTLNETVTKTNKELDDLQKSLEKQCNAIRLEEKNKYETELKRQLTTQELTFKSATAEMKAQIELQKREADMLNKTIDNLKNEVAEQRNLTKEIAQANSKAQITQKFGKD